MKKFALMTSVLSGSFLKTLASSRHHHYNHPQRDKKNTSTHWQPWQAEACWETPTCSEDASMWTSEATARRALARGMVDPAVASGIGGARLCNFRRVLNSKNARPLQIVVLGGSMPAGAFLECDDGPTSAKVGFTCSWPRRLEDALNSEGSNRAVVTNLAKGGTTTFWAVSEVHRVPPETDMVIVDYDVNDGEVIFSSSS